MKVHEYGAFILVEYESEEISGYYDNKPNAYRHLISSEKEKLDKWFCKRIEHLPYYRTFNAFNDLRGKLIENFAYQAYWVDLKHAEEFIDSLLLKYIEAGYGIPEITINIKP